MPSFPSDSRILPCFAGTVAKSSSEEDVSSLEDVFDNAVSNFDFSIFDFLALSGGVYLTLIKMRFFKLLSGGKGVVSSKLSGLGTRKGF